MNDKNSYPVDILDDEVIVRAVFKPYNVRKNGKVKINLFTPPKNSDELSCMRSSIMSITDCLNKSKEIAGEDKEFQGVAILTNFCANNSSPENKEDMVYIKDSRVHFLGHADLVIGIKTPPEEKPLPPEDKKMFDSIKENLYNHSIFIIGNGISGPKESTCDSNEILTNFANEVSKIISKN